MLVLLYSLELGLELLERLVLVTDVPIAFAGDREAATEQQHPTGHGSDQATGKAERPPIATAGLRQFTRCSRLAGLLRRFRDGCDGGRGR